MKCKFCKQLIQRDEFEWRDLPLGYATCSASPSSFHEPTEPEAAITNAQVFAERDAFQPEGWPPAPVAKVTKLVADNGPRVDTRRFPQATEAQPPHTVKIGAGIYTPRHCTCPNQADEDGAYCPICGKEKLSSQEPEAGSTRPEMPPAEQPWPDPTKEMPLNPLFNRIWELIKSWDINVPEVYSGYMGATGNHVRAIFDVVQASVQQEPLVAALEYIRDKDADDLDVESWKWLARKFKEVAKSVLNKK